MEPLSEVDGELLAFLAEHRVALVDQLATLTGRSDAGVRRRLRALAAAGLIAERRVLHRQPPAYLITRRGLRTLGSPLPLPRLNLQAYLHDLGAGWLWLAARDGAFGALSEIHSERRLRSRDGLPRGPDAGPEHSERLGVRLFDLGPGGRECLHYPDLVLRTAAGQRVALELELTTKAPRRLEGILEAYAADPRIDAVIYVVGDRRLEARIRTAAARAGASRKLFVRHFTFAPAMEGLAGQLGHASARGAGRAAGRTRGGERAAPAR